MLEIEVKKGLLMTVNTKHISAIETREFGGVFYLNLHMLNGDTLPIYAGEEDPKDLYMNIVKEINYNF